MKDADDVQVNAQQKPIIYLPSGEPVILKRPFGFAAHPEAHQSLQEKKKEQA